jgi:hypothetical protein
VGRKTEAESFGDFAAGRISLSASAAPGGLAALRGGAGQSEAWLAKPRAQHAAHLVTPDSTQHGAALSSAPPVGWGSDDEWAVERGRPRGPEMPSAPGGWLRP